MDELQPGGQIPLEDLFEDDVPWYSLWHGVNGGWLKTDKAKEVRKVELDLLRHQGVDVRRKISECLKGTGAMPVRL